MHSSAIQQSRRQRNMQKHHRRKDPITPDFPDPGVAHDHHPSTGSPDFPDPGGVHDHHLSTGNPRAICNQHSPCSLRLEAEMKLQFVRRVDGDVEVEDSHLAVSSSQQNLSKCKVKPGSLHDIANIWLEQQNGAA